MFWFIILLFSPFLFIFCKFFNKIEIKDIIIKTIIKVSLWLGLISIGELELFTPELFIDNPFEFIFRLNNLKLIIESIKFWNAWFAVVQILCSLKCYIRIKNIFFIIKKSINKK